MICMDKDTKNQLITFHLKAFIIYEKVSLSYFFNLSTQ
jgi:hypothetical protein